MKWLVFSKDRPYQLDAFIRTACENARINPSDISVLYHYADNFASDLQTLKSEHPDVEFLQQNDFRNDVVDWLSRNDSSIISFATDDALFTRRIPVNTIEEVLLKNPSVTTFSLRMGLHLEHCYPTNSSQGLPDGTIQSGLFVWNSNNAEGDWGYILSVDGHIFRRELIKTMFGTFEFVSPNDLESNWQGLRYHTSPIACCFPKSCYFNVPLNRVQETHANRCGDLGVDELQTIYRKGKRLSLEIYKNFINISAHQEVNLLNFHI